jgi:hypothetical protein
VVEGDFTNEGKQYPAGTSLHFKAGKAHGPHSTKNGCRLLVLWTERTSKEAADLSDFTPRKPKKGYKIVNRKFSTAVWPGDDDLLLGNVDRLNLGSEMFDADRIEHLRQRNGDVAEVRLVVPHADAVIGIAFDDQDLDLSPRNAEFGKACAPRPPRPTNRRIQNRAQGCAPCSTVARRRLTRTARPRPPLSRPPGRRRIGIWPKLFSSSAINNQNSAAGG